MFNQKPTQIPDSYAILRFNGGIALKSLTISFNDKLPIIDLIQVLKKDKTPDKNLKGINSVDDEYIFERFAYLYKRGYKLVSFTSNTSDNIHFLKEYIFVKPN